MHDSILMMATLQTVAELDCTKRNGLLHCRIWQERRKFDMLLPLSDRGSAATLGEYGLPI
jgi:hypothetical protein